MSVRLIRYGLAITGSCLRPDPIARMETQAVNIASRRIGGMDSSTRIETPHFLPGTQWAEPVHYALRRALMDSTLRAYRSSAVTELEQELWAIPKTNAGGVVSVEIGPLPEHGRNQDAPHSMWAATTWFVQTVCGRNAGMEWRTRYGGDAGMVAMLECRPGGDLVRNAGCNAGCWVHTRGMVTMLDGGMLLQWGPGGDADLTRSGCNAEMQCVWSQCAGDQSIVLTAILRVPLRWSGGLD